MGRKSKLSAAQEEVCWDHLDENPEKSAAALAGGIDLSYFPGLDVPYLEHRFSNMKAGRIKRQREVNVKTKKDEASEEDEEYSDGEEYFPQRPFDEQSSDSAHLIASSVPQHPSCTHSASSTRAVELAKEAKKKASTSAPVSGSKKVSYEKFLRKSIEINGLKHATIVASTIAKPPTAGLGLDARQPRQPDTNTPNQSLSWPLSPSPPSAPNQPGMAAPSSSGRRTVDPNGIAASVTSEIHDRETSGSTSAKRTHESSGNHPSSKVPKYMEGVAPSVVAAAGTDPWYNVNFPFPVVHPSNLKGLELWSQMLMPFGQKTYNESNFFYTTLGAFYRLVRKVPEAIEIVLELPSFITITPLTHPSSIVLTVMGTPETNPLPGPADTFRQRAFQLQAVLPSPPGWLSSLKTTVTVAEGYTTLTIPVDW